MQNENAQNQSTDGVGTTNKHEIDVENILSMYHIKKLLSTKEGRVLIIIQSAYAISADKRKKADVNSKFPSKMITFDDVVNLLNPYYLQNYGYTFTREEIIEAFTMYYCACGCGKGTQPNDNNIYWHFGNMDYSGKA